MSLPTIHANILYLLERDPSNKELTNMEFISLYQREISIMANPESITRALRKVRELHPEYRPTKSDVIAKRIRQWEKIQEYVK